MGRAERERGGGEGDRRDREGDKGRQMEKADRERERGGGRDIGIEIGIEGGGGRKEERVGKGDDRETNR